MKTMAIFLLHILLWIAKSSAQQFDSTVCDPTSYPPYTGPPLPSLPDQVTWRIEGNFVNKDQTSDYHQFIDYTNNHMALHSYRGNMVRFIFKFDTNELIRLQYPTDPNAIGAFIQCSISAIDKSRFARLLGVQVVNNKTHVAKPIDTLRLSKSNSIRYVGRQTFTDGVKGDVWEGCSFNAQASMTTKTTWYFSNPDSWYTSMGKISVPILMSVSGTTRDFTTGMMRSFNHQYNFADFRPYLTMGPITTFQIPEGVQCHNEVNTMPLPTLPTYFSISAEILDGIKHYVSPIKEYYDQGLSLTKYDYKEPGISIYGSNRLVRVHDFNTGVAYIMDPVHHNCSITGIKKIGYDDKMADPTHVRIRTPREFLNLDVNFAYVGQRVDRGITCDVWVGTRDDWPIPGAGLVTTWEHYFSADVEEAVGDAAEFRVPVKMRITSANPPIVTEYNFYEYNTQRSSFHNYDVSMCFNVGYKADFLLVFPGNYRTLVFKNIVIFKRLFVLAVTSVAYVSPIRVSNIGVDFNSTGLLLTFTLLDAPGIQGDVTNPATEPNLDGAIGKLTASLDSGEFNILLADDNFGDDNSKSITAKTYSFTRGTPRPDQAPGAGNRMKRDTSQNHVVKIQETLPSNNPLTAGSLAGLAVGVVIGGFLLGFLVVFIVCRVKSKTYGVNSSSFANPLREID